MLLRLILYSRNFLNNTNTMKPNTMKLHRILTIAALSAATLVSALPAQEAAEPLPSQAEMWRLIQAQQKQIELLTSQVASNQQSATATQSELARTKAAADSAQSEAIAARTELKATRAQVEATTLAVEEFGESAFQMPGWWEKTSIGGYGEMHANFYEHADNEIDFHRFVLFVNHEFNDWIKLYSEVEIEHTSIKDNNNGTGDTSAGEVKLEQAFVRLNWTEQFYTDAGIILMPIGILNDTHEPNTFYGVERNNVEARIIPTTWFEGGVRAGYKFSNGVEAEFAVTSGLDSTDGQIRGTRQEVAKAKMNDPAFTSRVTYSGIAGLTLGASVFYQDDLSQTTNDNASALLSSVHAVYSKGGFGLKALYARWDLDGLSPANSAAKEQYGFFIEPSYRWNLSETYGDLGVYFRYSEYEYFTGTALNENEIYEIGVNYWPSENVVFKADLQDISSSDQYSSKGDHVLNFGVGYQF